MLYKGQSALSKQPARHQNQHANTLPLMRSPKLDSVMFNASYCSAGIAGHIDPLKSHRQAPPCSTQFGDCKMVCDVCLREKRAVVVDSHKTIAKTAPALAGNAAVLQVADIARAYQPQAQRDDIYQCCVGNVELMNGNGPISEQP
jgi:hypothetical protein